MINSDKLGQKSINLMRNLIKKKSNQKILEHLNRLKLITIKKLSKSTYKNKK